MYMQFSVRLILFISLNIFFQTVFCHVRHVQYERTRGSITKNKIACGLQKNENKIVAVQMKQSDENNNCEGLSHDWLLNRSYSTGYDYIEKKKILDVFNPPIALEKSRKTFQWIFPTSFDVGAELRIFITIPTDWKDISFNIFDTVKEKLQISPDVSEIVMHHLRLSNDLDEVIVNAYIPGKDWGKGMIAHPCPVDNGGTHVIILESHIDFIRTIIDGKQLFDFPHAIHPKQAAVLMIFLHGVSSPLLIQNITMKGIA